MEDGTVYEISSIKPRVKTKMLVYGEARNTILNLIIGTNVQTYIKIKASDLVQVLEEMRVIEIEPRIVHQSDVDENGFSTIAIE